MLLWQTDASKFLKTLRTVKNGAPAIRRKATIAAAAVFVETADTIGPKDTNRYVAAWVEAGRAAGVSDLPVPQLKPSEWAHVHKDRLERQVQFWDRVVAKATTQDRFWKGAARRTPKGLKGEQRKLARDAEKELTKAKETLRRAVEEQKKYIDAEAAGNAPIVIYGNFTGRGSGPRRRLAITVRGKVYGGTGTIAEGPKGTVVIMKNREAHARIVETRSHTMRAALAIARAKGIVIARRIYASAVRGLAAKAG